MILTKDNLDEKLKEFFDMPAAQIDPAVRNEPEKALLRLLFLDDRTKRIEAARKKYEGVYNVTFVHNVKECLRYLCRQEYDIVSLDHDLDGDDFQNPDDVTSGMEVIRYIVKCGGFPPSQIVVPVVWIHSSNLLAANLMISELLKAGIPAYFRRFEYDDAKSFWDGTRVEKKEPIENKWCWNKSLNCFAWIDNGKCKSCGHMVDKLDTSHQCLDCYKREMKQCE